jgi:hypothetical protein
MTGGCSKQQNLGAAHVCTVIMRCLLLAVSGPQDTRRVPLVLLVDMKQLLTLVHAPPQALLEMKQLLLQFQKTPHQRVQRMLNFLNAQGYKQQFNLLEQELRDCLVQLSTILNVTQFTSQVGAAVAAAALTATPTERGKLPMPRILCGALQFMGVKRVQHVSHR